MKTKFDDSMTPKELYRNSMVYNHSDLHLVKTNVEILVTGRNGEILNILDLGSNVITNPGRSNMAHLIAGDDVTNRQVSSLKVGDGGHETGNPTQAKPVAQSDTDLFGTIHLTKVVSYEFPDGLEGNKVRFIAEIGSEEGNGSGSLPYSEVGLYDQGGDMMAHRTFGLITKSNAFGVTFRWTIIF